jgi:hypothetical protein
VVLEAVHFLVEIGNPRHSSLKQHTFDSFLGFERQEARRIAAYVAKLATDRDFQW